MYYQIRHFHTYMKDLFCEYFLWICLDLYCHMASLGYYESIHTLLNINEKSSKYLLNFYNISWHSFGACGWALNPWKKMTHCTHMVNTIAADHLMTERARLWASIEFVSQPRIYWFQYYKAWIVAHNHRYEKDVSQLKITESKSNQLYDCIKGVYLI